MKNCSKILLCPKHFAQTTYISEIPLGTLAFLSMLFIKYHSKSPKEVIPIVGVKLEENI